MKRVVFRAAWLVAAGISAVLGGILWSAGLFSLWMLAFFVGLSGFATALCILALESLFPAKGSPSFWQLLAFCLILIAVNAVVLWLLGALGALPPGGFERALSVLVDAVLDGLSYAVLAV